MAVLFTIKKGIVPAITCRNRPSICTNTRSSFDPTRNQGETPVVDYLWDDSGFSGNLAVGDDTFQKVFDKVDELSGVGGGTNDYNDLDNKPNLAAVATSGNYNDLSNKPNLNFIPLGTSVDNRIVRRNGTTGLLQDSNVTVDDNGDITGVRNIFVSTGVSCQGLGLRHIVGSVDDGNGGQYQAQVFPSLFIEDSDAGGLPLNQIPPGKIKISDQNGVRQIITDNDIPTDLVLAVTGDDVELSTGNGKLTFRMPYAMTLTSVRASVKTASSGTIIVDINQNGSSILSTRLSIDTNEKTSMTATVPAVIATTDLIDDAEITIDIDQIGSSTAGSGLKILLKGTRV